MVAFGSVLAVWALQRWPGQARGVLVAALALLARSHGPRRLL